MRADWINNQKHNEMKLETLEGIIFEIILFADEDHSGYRPVLE